MPRSILTAAALFLLTALHPVTARATEVFVENTCSETVQVAVSYTDSRGKERTEGYFRLPAGAERKLLRTEAGRFAFYAYDPGRSWRGAYRMPSVGDDYGLDGTLVTFDPTLKRYSHALSCAESQGDAALRQIRMATTCDHDVFIAVRYQDLAGQMQTQSWYRLTRGEVSYLPKTRADHFFYYGRSETFLEQGEETWFSYVGAHPFALEGKEEGFIRKDFNTDAHLLLLSCGG